MREEGALKERGWDGESVDVILRQWISNEPYHGAHPLPFKATAPSSNTALDACRG
jgi:hypothetical protein